METEVVMKLMEIIEKLAIVEQMTAWLVAVNLMLLFLQVVTLGFVAWMIRRVGKIKD